MKTGTFARITSALLLTALAASLTIWSPVPVPSLAQPLDRLEAPPGGRDVEADDLLDEVLAAGVLVVGTDAAYPPFSFLNEEEELVGFDVDVAKEVAVRLGVAVEFKTPLWGEVISGDWEAEWDVSIGSMTPTDTRATVLWFSEPYYYYPAFFAVHQDNTTFAAPMDLSGETVGVGESTSYEAYLEGSLELGDYGGVLSYPYPRGVDIVTYPGAFEALEDLAEGDGAILDAILTDQLLLHWAMNDGGYPIKYLGNSVYSEPIVFALDQARGPSDLMIAELNRIVGEMRADGTLTSISMTWLGIDVTSPGPAWPQGRVLVPLVLRSAP